MIQQQEATHSRYLTVDHIMFNLLENNFFVIESLTFGTVYLQKNVTTPSNIKLFIDLTNIGCNKKLSITGNLNIQ